jgi:UDP-galactopyranose mutase
MYEYLIVGAGLFGAVIANGLTRAGKKCLVIDKRNHIGGNIFTEVIEGINVHKYGAHIFHTTNKQIWDYLNQFSNFNHYRHTVLANYKGEIYNLPFNMNTFNRIWNVNTPKEAAEKIDAQIINCTKPRNLEEQAISLIGVDIYNKLVKGYTEKQWGRRCNELPPFIIKRIPVRYTYDNEYFTAPYQGIPVGGYTQIVEKMLHGAEVQLNTDYLSDRNALNRSSKKIVYTGMIDEYFDYRYGNLEYRSLRFENEIHNTGNYQGIAVMNYTDNTPWTRIIEHKHFEYGKQSKTVITKEYPVAWTKAREAYYPVNDNRNGELYNKYSSLAGCEDKVVFGGRLGMYRYMDMDEVIFEALRFVKKAVM